MSLSVISLLLIALIHFFVVIFNSSFVSELPNQLRRFGRYDAVQAVLAVVLEEDQATS
jgi:hypothetical protein